MSIKCWKVDVHDKNKFKDKDFPEDLVQDDEEDRIVIKCKCGNIIGTEVTNGFILNNIFLNDCIVHGVCLNCRSHFEWRHTFWKELSGIQ